MWDAIIALTAVFRTTGTVCNGPALRDPDGALRANHTERSPNICTELTQPTGIIQVCPSRPAGLALGMRLTHRQCQRPTAVGFQANAQFQGKDCGSTRPTTLSAAEIWDQTPWLHSRNVSAKNSNVPELLSHALSKVACFCEANPTLLIYAGRFRQSSQLFSWRSHESTHATYQRLANAYIS